MCKYIYMRRFLKLEIENIIKEYISGQHTIKELSRIFKTNVRSISCILKENNIKIFKKGENINRRKYYLDDNYFSIINTPEKAYLLGILFSDGCVANDSNTISLVSNDLDLLLFFKKELHCNKEIYKNPCHKTAYTFYFSSPQMKKDLVKLGCVPRKSLILNYPNISEKLEKYFWLGIYDGDGSLWISQNNFSAHLKIISSTEFINTLNNKLNLLDYKSKVWHENKNKAETSYLRICSRKKIYHFLNYLYDGNCRFFLKRKYIKFKHLETILKLKNNYYGNISLL